MSSHALNLPLSDLPDPLPIPVVSRPFRAELTPPGSKSLTNRALLLAALSDGPSSLHRPLVEADDARVMMTALADLGVVMFQSDDELQVSGLGGRWEPGSAEVRVDVHNSGTTARFLAAAALLSPVPVVIDGDARMRERPIGELIDALRELGATCDYLGSRNCPPVRITPPREPSRAALLTFGTTLSSQVISALLLVAPFLPGGLTIKLEGPVTSRSYVQMTLALLDRLGVVTRTTDDLRVVRVTPGLVRHFDLPIEPDASSATYFWAAAAMIPNASVTILGLSRESLQGDAHFPGLLERMGATVTWEKGSVTVRGPSRLDPILADLSDMPDAALTLAAVACFATGPSVLRGLRTLRHKESDRLAALATELARVGVTALPHADGDALTITPPPGGVDCDANSPVTFQTYRDHRMAMATALVGLRRPSVAIGNPTCVGKTYPGFWADLSSVLG